ncbi:nitroreductase/quinone reductase family protein [Paractinoplanes ferrugineus]|uniref:Nitroreductase n=1 Tax=Paractinoplanes ferrugineus TaxID=113564 RepID=A0A919J9A4_9ACTN|nr:nitroreductase family deazaflavin-dependent oxidoreductase [Actinoplanes ferrugineus]GIE15054.1 nitroreductase [Actinoplanes ferrugineus]
MSDKPFLPPRWVVLSAWAVHRGIYRISGGRRGLWRPRPDKWGMMRLTTVGRRSGTPRSVILAYYEDGADLVTMAMNGWGEGDPAWWLNLQAHPDGTVELAGATRQVRGRPAAAGAEHDRLWERWRFYNKQLDGYAALRRTPATVVVLEPLP